jgi:hypothetical protein
MHLDLTPLPQLGHQVADVYPCAAIYLGWVLPGQDSDTHAASR